MKIEHDMHVHTRLSLCSDGTTYVKDYAAYFRSLGIRKVAFTDHFWEGTPIERVTESQEVRNFYGGQNFAHVSAIRDEIRALTPSEKEGMEFYFGCECEYDPYVGDLAITERYAEQFDVILVPNSHTHMMMPKDCYHPYEKHKEFMMKAYMDVINSRLSKYVTAMAHPFEALNCPYDNEILYRMISDDEFRRMFDATARKGIAIEINTSSLRDKTPQQMEESQLMRMYRLAKECGCLFTLGSDAHAITGPKGHAHFVNAELLAGMVGLKEEDIHPLAR